MNKNSIDTIPQLDGSVTNLLRIIPRPISPIDLLYNLRSLLEYDLLCLSRIYTDEVLEPLFNGYNFWWLHQNEQRKSGGFAAHWAPGSSPVHEPHQSPVKIRVDRIEFTSSVVASMRLSFDLRAEAFIPASDAMKVFKNYKLPGGVSLPVRQVSMPTILRSSDQEVGSVGSQYLQLSQRDDCVLNLLLHISSNGYLNSVTAKFTVGVK